MKLLQGQTPYAYALALQRVGLTVLELESALEAAGLSGEDARFLVRSLPGGDYGETRRVDEGFDVASLAVDLCVSVLDDASGLPLGTLWDALRFLAPENGV